MGDTVFPWYPATTPPRLADLGTDTICMTIAVPCPGPLAGPAAVNLTQFLGVAGNVQYDSNPRRVELGP